MNAIANLVARRPRRILIVGLIAVMVAASIGGPLAGLLKAGNDFDDPGSQSAAARVAVERATGSSAWPDLVALVPTPSGAQSAAGAKAAADVVARLRTVPGIARAIPPSGESATVAKDGSSVIVPALFATSAVDADVVAAAQRALTGTDAVVGGSAVVQKQVNEQVQHDLLRAELIAMPLLLLLSLWIFRSPIAALIPVLVGSASVMGTFFVLRLIDSGITGLSIFALNLVTGLGLGIAIDYSLLMVSRFREELTAGREPRDAARTTVRTAGRTVVFSALTVAAALSALLVFPQNFLRSMAIAGITVPLVAMVVALTILPAALALLGRRVDALTPRRLVRREPSEAELAATRWHRLATWVLRRPGRVAAVTATILIVLGLPFLGAKFTSVDATALPTQHSSRQVADVIAARYPADAAAPILVAVRGGADRSADVTALRDRIATLDPAARVGQPTLAGDVWRIDVSPGASQLDRSTRRLVEAIRAVPTNLDVMVGGPTAVFVDQQDVLSARIPWALAILISTTLVLLFLLTGSVVLPIKAVLMNGLVVSATFGLLVMIFQHGNLTGLLSYTSQGALESTQPILLFAIAFALSTDYGTFLLSRIVEARNAGHTDRAAVAVGLARTGRIVTAAAILLMTAIGAFATSEIVFIKLVGVGAALSVLIDATVVRAFLVPALMGLLGRLNWWAPRSLTRLHRRIGFNESGPAPVESAAHPLAAS